MIGEVAVTTKRFLVFFWLIVLMGTVLSVTLNLEIMDVSAAPVSPYIMIIPEQTVNSTITPGMNYTITLYTDYDGSDVWGWQFFNLTFDPTVLQGIEVRNGDLISKDKNESARFKAGTFDNTLGRLSGTSAWFYILPYPPPTTSGPGTLATITFRVVGTRYSNLTLTRTQLQGFNSSLPETERYYYIINQDEPPGAPEPPYGEDHIGHGYFNNIPYGHDVAVTKVATPATAIIGDNVTIDVTVANEGSFTETFNLTVYANATHVGNQTITHLASGGTEIVNFIWNTTDIAAGTYVINATAWLPDIDMTDNNKTATIELKTFHDIAIISLQTPDEAIIGDFVTINATIENQGTFEETVNLTICHQLVVPSPPTPTAINITIFQLAKRPASETISVDWNTTGLAKGRYRINATVTIAQDEDPNDNSTIAFVRLLGHDVAITDISSTAEVFIGESATINVTVRNVGSFDETFDVTVTYGLNNDLIGTQQVVSLPVENSVTLSFIWDTTDITAGLYKINATAWLSADVNPTNNYKADTVAVATPIGQIAGTVVDASTGNPIDGAQVSANGYSDVTDANGLYNITNVPIGTYTVTASKDGFHSSSRTDISVITKQTTSLDFSLTPLPTTGNIAGIVTDASTGNPIDGANVTVADYFDITDETGHYNITNVPAGTYTVTANKDGYQSSSSTNVVVVARETITVDFELEPTPTSNLSDILLYAAIIIIAIAVIAGIAVYLRKTRRPK